VLLHGGGGVLAHLALLKTGAVRKKALICVGEKLENALRLQPAAAETRRQIHNLLYFLLKKIMVWGTQGMLLKYALLPCNSNIFFKLFILEWGCCRVLEELRSVGYILRF